jgi:hypothetical protein
VRDVNIGSTATEGGACSACRNRQPVVDNDYAPVSLASIIAPPAHPA